MLTVDNSNSRRQSQLEKEPNGESGFKPGYRTADAERQFERICTVHQQLGPAC